MSDLKARLRMGTQVPEFELRMEALAEIERLEKALADEIEMSGEAMTIVHLKAYAEGKEAGREEALLNSLKEASGD